MKYTVLGICGSAALFALAFAMYNDARARRALDAATPIAAAPQPPGEAPRVTFIKTPVVHVQGPDGAVLYKVTEFRHAERNCIVVHGNHMALHCTF